VKRIVKGEYVNMAELLKDNLEVERRRALSDGKRKPVSLADTRSFGPPELATVLQHVCCGDVCQRPGKD
jgi:hypothetical protein